MNKVFKKVFNATRGAMMVVNETTSSVQTGKKAAVTVAVMGALASIVPVASATDVGIVDKDGTFTVTVDEATLIYADGTVHANSLWEKGYKFEKLPTDKNIVIQTTNNYLSLSGEGESHVESRGGPDVVLKTTGDLTLIPGSTITSFGGGDELHARNISLGTITNTTAAQAGGLIKATENVNFLGNATLYDAVVEANGLNGAYSVSFNGKTNVNVTEMSIVNSMNVRDQATVTTQSLSIGGTLSMTGDGEFLGGIDKVTFVAKPDDGTWTGNGGNAPRIDLMGTKSIKIGELVVEKTPGENISEAMLIDRIKNTEDGVTSFTIDRLLVQEEAELSVVARSKTADNPATGVKFGNVDLNVGAKLNLGFRNSDFDSVLGDKTIDVLNLAQGSQLTVKSGTDDGTGVGLIDTADVQISQINFNGSGAGVAGNLVGNATAVNVADGVAGASIAKVSTKQLSVNIENPNPPAVATFARARSSGAPLSIGEVSEDTTVEITTSAENNTGDLQPLVDAVQIENNAGIVTYAVEENDVYGALSGSLEDGKLANVKEAVNTKTAAIGESMTAMPNMMTRILTNDLRKRMGDIRAGEGVNGVWARYNGGAMSGQGLDTDFHMLQVGIDTIPEPGAPRLGIAFSYAKSDTDAAVSSESDQYSLAGYGIWMSESGQFVDVIGRIATIDTEMVGPNGNKADLNNMALSLSGEYGWRFDLNDRVFVEPSAELTYTYVNAEQFTLGKVDYDMDSVDSLVGRLGVAAGLKCPNNMGEVYARVGVAHEFLGDATLGVNNNVRTYDVDGKDTWIEYAIGANFNINKNTYVYADIERTAGAEFDEDWRANVGVRYSF